MENSNSKRSKAAAIILGTAFLVVSVIGVTQYQNLKNTEKEILALNQQQENAVSENSKLNNVVDDLSTQLMAKVAEAETVAAELERIKEEDKKSKVYSYKNANRRKALESDLALRNEEIGTLKVNLSELESRNDKLSKDLEVVPQLEADKALLQKQLAEWETKYALLEKDFNELNVRYQKLIYDAPADNFKIEVSMKNGKLTSKARRAENINISFLMPSYLQKEKAGNETLYLSLFDEEIMPLEGSLKEVNLNTEKGTIPVAIHSMQDVNYGNNPQVVTFTFNVKEKLDAGSYKGKVYTKNDYLGTVDFRLR